MRDLIKNYLRDAEEKGGATTALQLAWLKAKRAELSAELDAGGQATLSAGWQGQNSSFDAGVSVRERVAALNCAIDRLEGKGGGLILARFRGIPH